MAQKRQNYKRIKQSDRGRAAYVSGSAVRKLNIAQPDIPDVNRESQERHVRIERQNKEIRRSNSLNFLYTVMVSLVVGAIFAICFQYLNLQTSVKNNASEVEQLEVQLNSLKESNDEMEADINASINLDDIYNTAIDELHMVYPDKSQVITYESGESQYVKQYNDIPDAK